MSILNRHLLKRANTALVRHQPWRTTNTSVDTPEGGGSGCLKREVIDLYKNLIYLSKEWPTDLRPKIKGAFMKNKDVQDHEEIKKLIARGEYVCREIMATYHLRKYRAMKRRYYSEDREKQMEEMFKHFSN